LVARTGASVTAVVGRSERGEGLATLGAEQVVVGTDDLQGPFDLALESAGGASLAACIRCCSQGGTVVVFGNSSGEETPISFRNLGDSRVRGFHVYSSGDRPTFGEDLGTLVSLIASGDLRPQVGYEGSWRDPRPAFEALRGRNVSGKAVLRID
jgi:NADPH:quinone reductase-like Zn-dependent oxidoreductase